MNDETQQAAGAQPDPEQMSEQELRDRLAEEMKKIHVRDILLQTIVTLVNLGGQRLGLTQDTREARDVEQSRLAIEALRVLLPLIEESNPGELAPVRDALAQLQVAYAREASATDQGGPPSAPADTPGTPAQPPAPDPPAQSGGDSGLWVPPGSKG